MKTLACIIAPLLLSTTTALQGTLLVYESFDGPIGQIPSGWLSGPVVFSETRIPSNNDYVTEDSLTYAGALPSIGGKWSLDSSSNQTYKLVFQDNPVAAGETIYASFLLQVNSFASSNGNQVPIIAFHSATVSDETGIGGGQLNGTSGFDVRRNSEDTTKFNISYNTQVRGAAHASATLLPDLYDIGETILVVMAYSRGATPAESKSELWINPDVSSFGSATHPEPSISLAGGNNDNIQSFTVLTPPTTNSVVSGWNIDELRIGTTWGSVTPIPEPSTYALLFGIGVLGIVFFRRRQ